MEPILQMAPALSSGSSGPGPTTATTSCAFLALAAERTASTAEQAVAQLAGLPTTASLQQEWRNNPKP